MKKFLRVTVPLLGIAWLVGHYFNNPVPPEMEESWFFNFHIGLISLTMDLVCNLVFEVEKYKLNLGNRKCICKGYIPYMVKPV